MRIVKVVQGTVASPGCKRLQVMQSARSAFIAVATSSSHALSTSPASPGLAGSGA